MEAHSESSKERKQMGIIRKKKISLENYVDFFLSHKHLLLTNNFLNQIINMHGFKRIYPAPKNVLIDALDAIHLIDPSRSTLKENSTSCPFMVIEDVIADLNDLNWQECCVTSIQTVNACKKSFFSSSSPAQISSLQCTDLSAPKLKSKQRRKVLKSGDLYGNSVDGSGDDPSGCGGLGIAKGAKKCVPKKKKAKVKAPGGDGNYGSPQSSALVSLGSC